MTHPVLDALLEVIETDPLPSAYTSSHWQRFGRETVVERRGKRLVFRGVQFGAVYERHPARRLLRVLERASYRSVTNSLQSYPRVWWTATRLARECAFGLTFDIWKSAVALSVLMDHWSAAQLSPTTVALIGDGYGFFGALMHRLLPGARLYCMDLPKILAFQVRTHETADPEAALSFLSARGAGKADITFVLPQEVERVEEDIDCAVNIASMQEMNPFTIAAYFAFLRRRSTSRSRFYCVNRLSKTLPGGEGVRFHAYPWCEDDEVFIDGPCPYYTHFLSFQTPWVNAFDGMHMHRLVRLAPEPPHRDNASQHRR